MLEIMNEKKENPCIVCKEFISETSEIHHRICNSCGEVYHIESAGTSEIIHKTCSCSEACMSCNTTDGTKCYSNYCSHCANEEES